MNKVADSVKKKNEYFPVEQIMLRNGSGVTVHIGVGVRGSFNCGGSVAEQLGAPADLQSGRPPLASWICSR